MKPVESTGTIVDLFCGCGGFSLGAELAGFRSLAAIDIEPVLQSGFKRNFPHSRAVQADLCDLDASDWRMLLNGKQRPDGVIGGPPCQGFSSIGKRVADDPRNSLVSQFFRHVALLRPRFFIMENVQGILRSPGVGLLHDGLTLLPQSYHVLPPMLVNASSFGAATSRTRVVLIGYDSSEMDHLSSDAFPTIADRRFVSVRDAIADLPTPIEQTKDSEDFGWAKYKDTGEQLSEYALAARQPPPSHLGSTASRLRHGNGYVSGLFDTKHSSEISERYRALTSGKSDPITKSYKLGWDGQCPTLRAGTGAERGAFQAVRPLHPEGGRVITVREAARLQGFPDWFEFHRTKWQSFRMIGNSVSPYVSFGLLDAIASKLRTQMAA